MHQRIHLRVQGIFRRNQNLPLNKQIKADVDDELDLMKQRTQAHYNLSEDDAIKIMNQAIKNLFNHSPPLSGPIPEQI